jgi:hypothetical protein
VTDRNSPQKHAWRAQIVLLTAGRCGTMELTRRSGTSKTSVWRWQDRFLAKGVAGLLHDKTRRSRIAPLSADVRARVGSRWVQQFAWQRPVAGNPKSRRTASKVCDRTHQT